MRLPLALLLAFSGGPLGAAPLSVLIEEAILGEVSAGLPEGARLELRLPEGAPARARRLIAVEHDLRQSAFAALAETDEGLQVPLRGRVFAVVDVPVPNRAIQAGVQLTASDFNMVTLPATSLGRFAVTDAAALEGLEVRRVLPEGRPVQSQSLQIPRVVRRGEKLTLIYQSGPLEVSAAARALEDAGPGDPVRVQNMTSNKTVTGIALRDGRVQVSP